MNDQPTKQIDNLPASSDDFWEGAEKQVSTPSRIVICTEHHFRPAGNTAICEKCPYGTILPGYMRVHEGKIIDLRDLT